MHIDLYIAFDLIPFDSKYSFKYQHQVLSICKVHANLKFLTVFCHCPVKTAGMVRHLQHQRQRRRLHTLWWLLLRSSLPAATVTHCFRYIHCVPLHSFWSSHSAYFHNWIYVNSLEMLNSAHIWRVFVRRLIWAMLPNLRKDSSCENVASIPMAVKVSLLLFVIHR